MKPYFPASVQFHSALFPAGNEHILRSIGLMGHAVGDAGILDFTDAAGFIQRHA